MRDRFHEAVRQGLIRDGWTITADPLLVGFGGLDMYVDLGAEKIIAATKENREIAVEIKTFLGASVLSDFHLALGQFLNYRLALELREPQRMLYLAVPSETYNTFGKYPFYGLAIERHAVPLIVYEPESESILQWLPSPATS